MFPGPVRGPSVRNVKPGELVLFPNKIDEVLHLISPEEVLDILGEVNTAFPEVEKFVWARLEQHISRRKLFVRSLNYKTTSKTLTDIFSLYGEIEEAAVIYDSHSQRSKGYGFVTYMHANSARSALEQPLKEIDGRLTETIVAARGRHLMSLGLLDVGQPPSAHLKSSPPVVMTTPMLQQSYGLKQFQNNNQPAFNPNSMYASTNFSPQFQGGNNHIEYQSQNNFIHDTFTGFANINFDNVQTPSNVSDSSFYPSPLPVNLTDFSDVQVNSANFVNPVDLNAPKFAQVQHFNSKASSRMQQAHSMHQHQQQHFGPPLYNNSIQRLHAMSPSYVASPSLSTTTSGSGSSPTGCPRPLEMEASLMKQTVLPPQFNHGYYHHEQHHSS